MVIPLLGDSSPCRGNIISGTESVREDGSSLRPILKKAGLWLDVFGIICIRIVHFNMYMY